jgi:cytochrome c biogenesis protein CcmG/thiol:disulfide interchange protein DsbE
MQRHPTSLDTPVRRRRRRWLVAGPLAGALVVVTWLLAFGLTRNPDSYRNPLVGQREPAVALTSLEAGEPIRLSRFHGQVVVVNFWGPWCNACIAEHPALAQAWHRYRDQGVVVLGVVYQAGASEARAFRRELGDTWPSALDPGSSAALAFGVRGAAETFIISRTGRIAAWHAGPVSFGFLSSSIDRLLGRRV